MQLVGSVTLCSWVIFLLAFKAIQGYNVSENGTLVFSAPNALATLLS